MSPRIATIERSTNETTISLTLNLDGSGKADIATENGGILGPGDHRAGRHDGREIAVDEG